MILVVATLSHAQAVDLAALPIEFVRPPASMKPADQDELNGALKRIARNAGTTTPPTGKLEKAWTELRRQDCATEDACVSQFAVKAGSLYGLYTSIDTTVKGDVVAVGRIVRDDGKVVRPTVSARVAKAANVGWSAQVKQALEQLVKQLDPGTLPVTREVATRPVDPPAVVDAGVAVAVVAPPDAGVSELPPPPPPPLEASPLKTVGLVTAVSGGALLAGGGVLLLIGRGQASAVLNDDGSLKAGSGAAQAAQARSATTMQTIGATLGAVGLGAGVAGLVVWLLAPEPARPVVTAGPLPGGAAVFVTGELP
ncbi:MAG: hypothetical protein JNJ54_14155 [Myxococcaceae bacterium]|nr:hypothetical protein [Myxococcaceae bacterium]